MKNNSMKRILASLLVISFCSLNSAVLADPATSHITVNNGETVNVDGASGIVYDGIGAVVDNALGGTVNLSGNFTNNQSNAAYSGGGVIYSAAQGIINVEKGTTFEGNILNPGTGVSAGGAISSWSSSLVDIGENVSFIQNGYTPDGNISSAYGGAIYVDSDGTSSSQFIIGKGTKFDGNVASSAGAVYIGDVDTQIGDANAQVGEQVIFQNNKSVNGGGAIMSGSAYKDTTISIGQGTVFKGNEVTNGSGGAIYNSAYGATEISIDMSDGVQFYSNKASVSGGAIYNSAAGAVINTGAATFTGNSAGSQGGAIYNSANATVNVNSSVSSTGETIAAASFDGNTALTNGGAIHNEGVLSVGNGVSFTNNKVVNSDKSQSYGGAIFNNSGASATLGDDLVFTGNEAGRGGAVYNYVDAQMSIGKNAHFEQNNASYAAGGALINFGDLEIGEDALFENNTSQWGGAAIYVGTNGSTTNKVSTIIKEGAQFINNSPANENSYGGAIYVENDVNNPAGVSIDIGKNSVFEDNSAQLGGAIFVNTNVDATIQEGATFESNSATMAGGAIAAYSDMVLTNANFTGNEAGQMGGAIAAGADITIDGGTFSDNTAGVQGGAIYTIGNLVLDTTNKDISFLGNTIGIDNKSGNDIYLGEMLGSTAAMQITGSNTVSLGGGVAGVRDAKITNASNLVLESGSVNSGFVGTYTQTSGGSTEVNSEFFGGKSNIDGGQFTLNDGANIVSGSAVTVDNGSGTVISNAANVVINGSLTDKGTLNNGGNITVSGTDSLLAVGGYTQSEGSTLTIGDGAILDALNGALKVDNLIFQGNGGIASGDVITVEKVTFAQQADTITMDGSGIGVGGGHVAISADSNFVMDGTDVNVTGNELTQNIIVKDADISGENPDLALAIGSDSKDVTLTLSNNATTSSGVNVTDGSTLKLSPNAGSNLIIDVKNEITGTGSVLVDEIIDKVQQPDGTTEDVHKGVGTITINSDNSGFTGSYTQNMGNVILTDGSKFFNGTNLISGGSLTAQQGAILTATTVEEGTVNLQEGAILDGTLNVTTDSVNNTYGTVNIYNPIKGDEGLDEFEGKTIISEDIINDGNLTYVNPDSTEQSIQITDAGLGLFNNTIIDSGDDSTFTLGATPDTGVTHLTLGNGSGIEAGNIILNEGTSLTYKDNAYIQQDSAISVGVDAVLNFDNNTDIDYNPIISSVDNTASLNKTGDGALVINSTMKDYHGSISVNGGGLNLAYVEDSVLDFNNLSVVNAIMHVSSDTSINGSGDKGNLYILNSLLAVDGSLDVEGQTNLLASELYVLDDLVAGGPLTLEYESELNVKGDASLSGQFDIKDGSIAVINGDLTSTNDVNISGENSTLTLNGKTTNVNNLTLNDGVLNNFNNMTVNDTLTIGQSVYGGSVSTFNMLDGGINSIVTENTVLNGDVNMSFDYDPRSNDAMDQIITNNFASSGDSSIIISGINFITSPDDYTFNLDGSQLISQGGTGVANLGESQFIANTAIGQYLVTAGANGGSAITGTLQKVNPQMYRAQVATVAQYANQLAFNNIIFDHAAIISGQLGPNDDEVVNRFAASNPLFAPYQYSKKDGGVWFKAYGNIENISMTKGLHVDNTAYGAVIGADLPVVKLKDGWKLIPTAYMAYNGGHQNYDFVSMYQNGGQIGAMATAYKGNFFTSLLAYGGGYSNEMNVRNMGYGSGSDTTGNWFAGVASKSAYNIHLPKDFILQPTALVAYNIFGNQSYNSAFGGNLSMTSGYLNGINVAPGVNLIWNKKTFSIYGTAQMVFNIMGGVDGTAGKVTLDDVRMKHPYFEYGLGVVKSFKERLSGFCQFTIRNGGRTGIGFMGGFQYKL